MGGLLSPPCPTSAHCAGNTGLRSLNLGSNNIGDQGATVLAEALKVLSSTVSISIHCSTDADNSSLHAFTRAVAGMASSPSKK